MTDKSKLTRAIEALEQYRLDVPPHERFQHMVQAGVIDEEGVPDFEALTAAARLGSGGKVTPDSPSIMGDYRYVYRPTRVLPPQPASPKINVRLLLQLPFRHQVAIFRAIGVLTHEAIGVVDGDFICDMVLLARDRNLLEHLWEETEKYRDSILVST